LGEIFERVLPDIPLEWTGERLTTGTAGQVELEHLHRYFLARALCRGLDVLDVAAGEGYGTALLAQVARSVIGVEISTETVAHAAAAYRGPNLRFLEGDARCLPLDDASVDAVVSFETIEHVYEHDQFLAEVRRVLRPGGRFIGSSPERDIYSPSGSSANPYHVHELSRAEFSGLLRRAFAHVRLLGQRPMLGSAIVSEGDGPGRSLTFEKRGPRHFEAVDGLARPVYFVAVASDQSVADVPDSLYIETAEVGAVLASAGVAEAATAELTGLRAARADAESARIELSAARAEAAAACSQRDVARIAVRRAAAAAEGHWRGLMTELEHRAARAERQAAEAAHQAAEAACQAAEWRHRYEGLRARLERLLRRFWILRASRVVPASARRFVRERLLG
jgi:SAM-dependent methyltransferase